MKKQIIAIIVLSVGLVPLFACGANWYVDSTASADGNGASDSPFKTIRAALDASGAGDTIWVRGGEGRSYTIAGDSDALQIPETKEGLFICAYETNPGDGGRAVLAVADDYITSGNKCHIVSNGAANVTFSGFICSYGKESLGKQKVGDVRFVFLGAPNFTLSACEFFCTGVPGYLGSGANGIVTPKTEDLNTASGLTIDNCFFHDTTGYRVDTAATPVFVPHNTTIQNSVFSNVWRIAADPGPNKGKYTNFTFVSNVVYVGAIRGDWSPTGANFQFGSLFSSGYGGLGENAEIAYNVFIGTDEDWRGIFAMTRFDGFGGKQRFHHNVIRNFAWTWRYQRGGDSPNKSTVIEMFDNIFDLTGGRTIVFDEGYNGDTPYVGRSIFVSGSFFRNNALVRSSAFWGGASALANGYDRSVVLLTNNVGLAASPEFVETNDIYSADFYRPKLRLGQDVDLRRIGWTGENDEYPRYVGAREPIVMGSFTIHLR